jgi:DNA-binding HxlR family transcriptional regulator
MHSYGQFCPIAKAAELFCERWTAVILRDLLAGATRFSQLRRGAPLSNVSRRMVPPGRSALFPAGWSRAPWRV